MSGVIDKNGQQWEHCNCCGKWVEFENLEYDIPNPEAQKKYASPECPWISDGQKLDLCESCA